MRCDEMKKKKGKVNYFSDMLCLTFISVIGGFGFYHLAYLITENYLISLFSGLGFSASTSLLLTTLFMHYWERQFKK